MDRLADFREVWLCDFEFSAPPGERPTSVCMVAREFRSGRLLRLWADELAHLREPPFATGRESLFVAYFASAELGCFLSLPWPMPARILDLYAEFRCLTSGLTVPCGNGLLGALSWFGLDGLSAVEKDSMRALAQRGEPYTAEERRALLDYCQSDVDALARLLPVMAPRIDVPRALLRGRYMAAVARMEWTGTPLDAAALALLRDNWLSIQDRLIECIDAGRGIYLGRTFKAERFADWLTAEGIPWPRLASGALDLSDDCFHEMGRAYPDRISPVRELRQSLSLLRLESLAVGNDDRNRCLLSPFGSRTGRNQPSNAAFMFGPSTWLRGLIRPEPGRALAYVDWEQQEFGIAAALSGDRAMMDAYASADPYLTFAKQAGAVPRDGTKGSHKAERERFKVLSLAVQYGMGPEALARKLDEAPIRGRELLALHRRTYPRYWQWSDAVEMTAFLSGRLQTAFGWTVHVGPDANPRSLRNFPLQGNGAEMLRLACIFATERGINVCAPVHDALLVEGADGEIEAVVDATQAAMREASEVVLSGFRIRTEAKIVRRPGRYMDPRGERFWREVWDLIGHPTPITHEGATPITRNTPVHSYSSLSYTHALDLQCRGVPPSGRDDRAASSEQATAAASNRGALFERPDPLALARSGRTITGEGPTPCLRPLAGSGDEEEPDRFVPAVPHGWNENTGATCAACPTLPRSCRPCVPLLEAGPGAGSDHLRNTVREMTEAEAIAWEGCRRLPDWDPAELAEAIAFPVASSGPLPA